MAPSYYTIHAAPNFDPEVHAEKIDRALRAGDKDAVAEAILGINNKQRQMLKEPYRLKYGKELDDALAKGLGGDLETLLLALVATPLEYDVQQLKAAMKGMGTDENTLIEIVCSRTPEQLRAIRKHFEKKYGKSLEAWVEGDTSGEFRDILIALITNAKDDSDQTSDSLAKDDAVRLFADGKGKFSGKGSHFLHILATQNPFQLRKVFSEFEALSGHTIEKAIEKEFSGDLRNSYLAIVRSSANKQRFFAMQLNKSMKGLGTDDNSLIRCLVARSEVDLNLIKDSYKEIYTKSLEDDIKGDTSGMYRDSLLRICQGNESLF